MTGFIVLGCLMVLAGTLTYKVMADYCTADRVWLTLLGAFLFPVTLAIALLLYLSECC